MSRRTLLPLLAIVVVAACAAPNRQAVNELVDLQQAADGRGSLLFWSTPQRRVGFANIDQILPVRRIEAGVRVLPLEPALRDLGNVSYEVDGTRYVVSEFLADPASMGLIVVQDGKVLYEHYADGHDADTRWISFSVTKSVTSLLIGAAIQDGFIDSVDTPVVHYLPRLRGTSYEHTTIRHVLNMASGVRWNEDYADPNSDVSRAGAANGVALVRYLADLPNDAAPGEKFNYNTGETNLAGELLRAAIGNNAATYLTHRIWQPFGMQADAYWMLGEAGGGELGGCCINATLRDYARIGMFALADGVLTDGTRVLPEGWMAESVAPSRGYEGYGYLWWLDGDGAYSARGIFGQTIRIDPASGLVIAMHSNAPAAVRTDFHAHQTAVMAALRAALR